MIRQQGYVLIDFAISTSTSGLSTAQDVQGLAPIAILMPDGWTAADLSFQKSADNIAFRNVYDQDGAEVVVKATTSAWVDLLPAEFPGVLYLKLRSGTLATAVQQAAARTVTLVARPTA
jgi:hypothetical protein